MTMMIILTFSRGRTTHIYILPPVTYDYPICTINKNVKLFIGHHNFQQLGQLTHFQLEQLNTIMFI